MPGGETAVNVLNFAGEDPSDLPTVRDRVETFYRETRTIRVAAWSVRQIDIGVYTDPDTAPVILSHVPDPVIEGNAAGNPLPNEVALCLSFRSAEAVGRHRSGRIYLGGLAASTATVIGTLGHSVPSNPTISGIADNGVIMVGTEVSGTQLILRDRVAGVDSKVTSLFVDQEWDTQQRRSRQLLPADREVRATP